MKPSTICSFLLFSIEKRELLNSPFWMKDAQVGGEIHTKTQCTLCISNDDQVRVRAGWKKRHRFLFHVCNPHPLAAVAAVHFPSHWFFFLFVFLVKMKYIGGGSFICPHLSQVEREPSDFWRRFQNDVGRYQTVRKTIFCGASLLPIFKFLLKNSELNKNVCIIIRRWWNVCVRVLKFKKIKKEREEGGNSYPGADRRPSWPVRKSSSSHKSLSLSLFSFLKNF
jgi:hypothetical protein